MSSKSKKSASGGSKAIGAIPKVDCNKDPNAPKQLPTAYQTKTAGLDPAVQGNLRVLLQDTNISLSDLDSLGKAVTINTEYLESNDETLRFDPLAADGASLSQSKMKNRVEKEDKDPDIVYSEIMTEIAPTLTKKRSDTIQLPKTTVIKDVDRRIPIKACPTTPRKKVQLSPEHQAPMFSMREPTDLEGALDLVGRLLKYTGIRVQKEKGLWHLIPDQHPDLSGDCLLEYLAKYSGPSLTSFINWLQRTPSNALAASQGVHPTHDFCSQRLTGVAAGKIDPCCVCLAKLRPPPPEPAPAIPTAEIRVDPPTVPMTPSFTQPIDRPINPPNPVKVPIPEPLTQPAGPYIHVDPKATLLDLLQRGVRIRTRSGELVKLPIPKSPAAISRIKEIRGQPWETMIRKYIMILPPTYKSKDYLFDTISYC